MQLLSSLGTSLLDWQSKAWQPSDPLYESYTNKSGKTKLRRRPMPPGLSSSERSTLAKVRRAMARPADRQVRLRAHYLDEGDRVKPHRSTAAAVKWHRFLVSAGVLVHGRESIISVTGDVEDVLLYYSLILRPAMAAGIPTTLRHRMLLSACLAIGRPDAGRLCSSSESAGQRTVDRRLDRFGASRGHGCH